MMEKTISIQLVCSHFPGTRFVDKEPIYVGVQKKTDIVDEVPGDVQQATFTIPVQTKMGKDGNPDYRGPYVQGRAGDRFIYLVWFEYKGSAKERFRRAKIKLNHLTWEHLQEDLIEARLTMTDQTGCPVCATVPEGLIHWQVDID